MAKQGTRRPPTSLHFLSFFWDPTLFCLARAPQLLTLDYSAFFSNPLSHPIWISFALRFIPSGSSLHFQARFLNSYAHYGSDWLRGCALSGSSWNCTRTQRQRPLILALWAYVLCVRDGRSLISAPQTLPCRRQTSTYYLFIVNYQ